MSTYDYILQGVALTDKRWANAPGIPFDGVWHLAEGTGVLPHFPGLRATTFHRPGQHGESQAQFAPLAERSLSLRMRFLAVCSDPSNARYGRQGEGFDERMAFMEANVNEFFFRSQLGATSNRGYLELKRVNNVFEHFPGGDWSPTHGEQTTAGRFIASSEPEMDRDARWVDYTLIFHIPEGTWWTDWEYRKISNVRPNQTTNINVPMGTAPIWDARIAIRTVDPDINLQPGTRFLNDLGIGFRVSREIAKGPHWRVFGTVERAYGGYSSNTGDNPNWDVDLNNQTILEEVGRPQGSLLMISPGVAGDSRPIGRIRVRPTAAIDVALAVRPRWF